MKPKVISRFLILIKIQRVEEKNLIHPKGKKAMQPKIPQAFLAIRAEAARNKGREGPKEETVAARPRNLLKFTDS